MMEKKLKEAEFALLLMLLGLPCLLRIYMVNINIFWLLLAIIDAASAQYLDEAYIVKHMEEITATARGKRVRFYIIAIMAGYLLIGFKSFSLISSLHLSAETLLLYSSASSSGLSLSPSASEITFISSRR